jgi:hypothetical protein
VSVASESLSSAPRRFLLMRGLRDLPERDLAACIAYVALSMWFGNGGRSSGPPTHNPVARDLRSPKYRPRVVKSKKTYRRKLRTAKEPTK